MVKKYDICILDDKLPIKHIAGTDDTKIIGTNLIWHLLENEEQWEDADLLSFIKLLNAKDNYTPCGFTNHDFFLNHIQETIYSPDIIIFDWDVGTATDPSVNLLEILESTYSLVAIFTSHDKTSDVTNEIAKSKYSSYKDSRLFIIEKEVQYCATNLDDKIAEKQNIFSFKYSKELKQKTLRALDKTLSNIGSISFNQFVSIFGNIDGAKSKLSSIDFSDIITDKIKYELINIGFDNHELEADYQDIKDEKTLRKIWHFRLYQNPQDDKVRKGDIIKKEGENNDILYFVLSSDCHLNGFWKKNFGSLSLIPLYKVDGSHVKFKEKISFNSRAVKNYSLSSLVNPSMKNMIVLPGLVHANEAYIDYALLHRDITSIEIPLPSGGDENMSLLYNHISEYTGNDRLNISEPFLTPLVNFILENITGYGLPDFSKEFKTSIQKKLSDILD